MAKKNKRNMLEWFEEKWHCSVTKNKTKFFELVKFYGVDKTWLRGETFKKEYGIIMHEHSGSDDGEIAGFSSKRVRNTNGYGYTTEVTTYKAPMSREVLDYLFPDKEDDKS